MKQLFWKEWRELRLLPLAAAIGTTLLGVAWLSFLKRTHQPLGSGDTFFPLFVASVLTGIVSGAGLIAQEVGSSLTFLSVLPVNRRRIWCVKVATAAAVALVSFLACTLICAAIGLFMMSDGSLVLGAARPSGTDAETALASMIVCFTCAVTVSPFFDRAVSAVVAALLLSVGLIALLVDIAELYVNYFGRLYGWPADPHLREQDPIVLLLIVIVIPVFLTISYWTFTRGETLRSSKRFRVGALASSVSLAVGAIVFCSGSCLHWW